MSKLDKIQEALEYSKYVKDLLAKHDKKRDADLDEYVPWIKSHGGHIIELLRESHTQALSELKGFKESESVGEKLWKLLDDMEAELCPKN